VKRKKNPQDGSSIQKKPFIHSLDLSTGRRAQGPALTRGKKLGGGWCLPGKGIYRDASSTTREIKKGRNVGKKEARKPNYTQQPSARARGDQEDGERPLEKGWRARGKTRRVGTQKTWHLYEKNIQKPHALMENG